jgi:hypothetical protein
MGIREITFLYPEYYTKHIYVCGQNSVSSNVKTGDTYSYHRDIKK